MSKIDETSNSFQRWAAETASYYDGVAAIYARGNWVEIDLANGDSVTCMTTNGVKMTLENLERKA